MKGAPMMSRVGAETKDKSTIFFKGTGKGTKDQYGNEIQSELYEARLQRIKNKKTIDPNEERKYMRPKVDKADILQLMHEN